LTEFEGEISSSEETLNVLYHLISLEYQTKQCESNSCLN